MNPDLSAFPDAGVLHALFLQIDEQKQKKESVIVAIDGNSSAGKSSLAGLLKSLFFCNVIPMDDFFLQPDQRTPERFREPGGNIDYERFEEEVLKRLRDKTAFSYRPYDCSSGLLAAPVLVPPNRLTIVEGVYSQHPALSCYYDVKVFMSLDYDEQCRRLRERNAGLFDRFVNEWIPMENRYFEYFSIKEKCDYVIVTHEERHD